MAITFPLSLPSLADKLKISSVKWDVQRYDEYSGMGSGHEMQSEMAPPKWTADISLAAGYNNDAKQIAAILRKLHGAQNAFMLYDPISLYPQSDPEGFVLGSAAVTLHTVGADRQSLRLQGLPNGYVLTIGDKGQITFGSNPQRNFFFEVSETVTASSGGITPAFEIFPHIPVGLLVGRPVTLAKPACKMALRNGSFTVGNSDPVITEGASLQAIEKK